MLDPVVLLLLLLLLVSLLHYGVSARYAVRVEASISISSLSWGWGMCRSIVTRATDASAAAHARHSAVAALAISVTAGVLTVACIMQNLCATVSTPSPLLNSMVTQRPSNCKGYS